MKVKLRTRGTGCMCLSAAAAPKCKGDSMSQVSKRHHKCNYTEPWNRARSAANPTKIQRQASKDDCEHHVLYPGPFFLLRHHLRLPHDHPHGRPHGRLHDLGHDHQVADPSRPRAADPSRQVEVLYSSHRGTRYRVPAAVREDIPRLSYRCIKSHQSRSIFTYIHQHQNKLLG